MTLRRALFVAACVLPAAAAPAAAQFQQPGGQPPPCIQEFIKLRTDAEKKAKAIQAASQRKVAPAVACKLFNAFSAAEVKMIKYATDQGSWCGIPTQAVAEMKKAHAKTNEIRTKVCQAAAAPPRPQGPTLSDALAPPAPSSSNIRTGHGTFDTLTGTPLGNR